MKISSRLGWPYTEMLDLLSLPERYWNNYTRTSVLEHVPQKIMVCDLAVVLKAWAYFYHHNLDTNQGGFELTIKRASILYLLLTS